VKLQRVQKLLCDRGKAGTLLKGENVREVGCLKTPKKEPGRQCQKKKGERKPCSPIKDGPISRASVESFVARKESRLPYLHLKEEGKGAMPQTAKGEPEFWPRIEGVRTRGEEERDRGNKHEIQETSAR